MLGNGGYKTSLYTIKPILLSCVWMKHFNNVEKLKCIVFELLAIKFPSFSK